MISTETIREATVIMTEMLLKGDSCLQLATAEAIDRRVINGYYAKPTNYTSIGVNTNTSVVGRGA